MNIAIRYYSKTGHMKKMADVVSAATGVEAKPISESFTAKGSSLCCIVVILMLTTC